MQVLTGSEAWSATERPVRPQVAMHYTRPDQFQEQVEWILEFVIHACLLDSGIHCSREGTVSMRVRKEPRIEQGK